MTASTIVITNWLTVKKYQFLKWQWIFSFTSIFFIFPLTFTTFSELDYPVYLVILFDLMVFLIPNTFKLFGFSIY